MRILFQGGWKSGRNEPGDREVVDEYCRSFARRTVKSSHTLVLAGYRQHESLIADEVVQAAREAGRNVKDYLTFLLPYRDNTIPPVGRVVRIPESAWWIEDRSFVVRQCDAVVAVGGGRGTFDCVEKAILAQKPVFVARALWSHAARAWEAHRTSFSYLEQDEPDVLDDINATADEWVDNVFRVLDRIAASKYPRRIFIVHGRDHARRDQLADLVKKLGFEPVILEKQGSRGLTIIEKLERDAPAVGFAFVLYDADDVGALAGQDPAPRARQNVVFEHGLLIGLLGRSRTCAIVSGGVEIPSDIQGILYERVDSVASSGLQIAKILSEADYDVDLRPLMS